VMSQRTEDGDEEACREVVLLGAGFSHAVSGHFPLTRDLGPAALGVACVPEERRPAEGTGFEAWLSRIGEDQPYRSAEENLAARQLFVRMTTAIGQVLAERQEEALKGGAPSWLEDLLSVLHARRSTVVSFNYDNVVECAVDGHCLADLSGYGRRKVTSHDILDRLPPLPPSILSEEAPVYITPSQDAVPPEHPLCDAQQVARSFRLLKLHGSLSWYWAPDDATGVTLQRWRSPGTFGKPAREDEEERRRALPGRVPFIVPPTATKSSYLTNLVVREIWARARAALAEAQRLIVIGYSVPPEDQVASGMLAEALGRRDVEVVIADPCAGAVKARLWDLGVTSPAKCFDKQSCVEDFTAWYRDEQAASVVEELRAWALSADLGPGGVQGQVSVLPVSPGPVGHVDVDAIELNAEGGDLVVPLRPMSSSTQIDQEQVPKLLRSLSDNSQVRRLVLRIEHNEFPVVTYRLSPPTKNAAGVVTDPGNHLTIVLSGHLR
jgi:hypothetical protein